MANNNWPWPGSGKWPIIIIPHVYNMHQEDEVGIIALEALNAFNFSQQSSSLLAILVTTMSQASYMTSLTTSATFTVCAT